jgi:hypothetical protein
MNKHLKRLLYGLIFIILLALLVMALGFKTESNSDSDPILRIAQPIIEAVLCYLYGAGIDLLIFENYYLKKQRHDR